ncbi:hypothetical protein [Soonwooa sp.]|uniref:hypothetical protein n=1 Tax=Soonwooa sp. TaxID=1938592 RepID=UPI0026220A47|nr:hypothetical protein [Soonwooa sp.]
MNLVTIRVLLLCLIPIGIFILIKVIKIFKKSFSGAVISEIAFSENGGQFSIEKAGYFSVWQKGQMFKRTPVDKFKVCIYDESTKEEVDLNISVLRPQINDFSTGRMELYRFYAPIGNYKIEFRQGSNISKLESFIGGLMPLQPVDLSKYSIQIRESQPQFLTALAIPLGIIGFAAVICGLVFCLLADQLFN